MIRQMKDSDWKRVAEIYTQGLGGGLLDVVLRYFFYK